MNAVKRNWICAVSLIMLIFTIYLCCSRDTDVYASEEAVLSVYQSSDLTTPVRTFDLNELKEIAAQEGGKKYNYSGYNTFPSFKECINAEGPTLIGIINASGLKLNSGETVKISDKSGYSTTLIAEELSEDRYYFPKGKNGTENGNAAPQESYEGSVKVPAIIDISDTGLEDNGVLRFGQVAPNEQNFPGFVKYVLNDGKLIVGGNAENCEPVQNITDSNGKQLADNTSVIKGTELHIEEPEKNVKIYYTLDGSEPTDGSQIYNYSEYVDIKYPKLDTAGSITLKVKTVKYGKYDSEPSTFRYNVVSEATPVPQEFKAARAGYSSIKLSWKADGNIESYNIYRKSSGEAEFGKVAEIEAGSTSYTDKGLKTGTTYSYRIKAVASGLESDFSATATATPTTAVPGSFKAARAGYSSIKLTWNPVSGASGYRIERYDSKTRTYKYKKYVTGGKSESAVITDLKTGTKYYFKIRSYRTVDGVKKYSDLSSSRYAVPSLSTPSIKKLTPGTKKVTVSWNKISGAHGYKIYRATSRAGSYKLVKTTSSTSFTDKSLKKGKKYYYKLKAYRKVDGKLKYSSYSAVKYTTAK